MGDIKKQSISNTVLSYIGAVLGFLIIYIQPQLITSGDIGLLRMLYSFSLITAMVMPFGAGSVVMRYFPKIRNPDNSHNGIFALIFLVVTAGTLIIGGLLYLYKGTFVTYFSNAPEFTRYFNEAIVLAYILSMISVYSIYSSALFKTTFTVFLTDIFARLGQLVVVILYYYGLLNQKMFVIGYLVIFVLQLFLLIIYLAKSRTVSFRINFRFYKTLNLKELVFFGLLMMLTAFASLGIKFIDQLMVGHFLSSNLVGIYATSVMMCVVMEIPFNSLDRIASPKIAHAWNLNNVKEVEKIYEMSSRYMFFLGGLLFCILWASVDLIFLFLPTEYHLGKMAFYVVSFSSLLNLLTGVNTSVITFSSKYFVTSLFLFTLMGVAVIANNLLIPRYGITGAAYATLIAIGVFNILKYMYILLQFKMQPLSKNSLYTLAGIIVSISFILILPSTLHAVYKGIAGCAFTVLVFSAINVKFGIILEINKIFRKFGLITKP